jgi:hypothetical protein
MGPTTTAAVDGEKAIQTTVVPIQIHSKRRQNTHEPYPIYGSRQPRPTIFSSAVAVVHDRTRPDPTVIAHSTSHPLGAQVARRGEPTIVGVSQKRQPARMTRLYLSKRDAGTTVGTG